jgi:hypothetical protein
MGLAEGGAVILALYFLRAIAKEILSKVYRAA